MRKFTKLAAFTVAAVTLAFGVGGAAMATHNGLHGIACDLADTVGGGAAGNSPGPTGLPISDHLGWDVGNGQCNGSFTRTLDAAFPSAGGGGIELGMRAEQRSVGQVANNAGDYEVQTGNDTTAGVADRAWWNFQHSIAYDGNINDLDGLSFAIRTDAGLNFSGPVLAACFTDMRLCRFFLDDRHNQPNPTSTYTDLYQTSQNPEFSWFTTAADGDANPNGDFDYDVQGAWTMTLTATKDAHIASVSICIHTPNEVCSGVPPFVYTCSPFEPPMDKTVVVKAKAKRILPLKMVCTDESGAVLTDQDIDPPEVQVLKITGGAVTTDNVEFLSSGKGTVGNQFVYDGNRFWQFNLNTRNFDGQGTYLISVNPGSVDDVIAGAPTATFVIN